MKKLVFVALAIIGLSKINVAQPYAYDVDFNYFYANLSPHGEWIKYERSFVWRPYVSHRDWAPYKYGNWIYSDYGWYWDSDEPFGWAVYHYGRWHFDDYYGWIWTPGYDWAPAWVQWRYDDYYVGWAPLPPSARWASRGGLSISINFFIPAHRWVFVEYRYITYPAHKHVIYGDRVHKVFNRTKVRTNYYERGGRVYNGGIDRNIIERYSGRKIDRSDIKRSRDYNISKDRYENYRSKINRDRFDDDDLKRDFKDRNIYREPNSKTRDKNRITRDDFRKNEKYEANKWKIERKENSKIPSLRKEQNDRRKENIKSHSSRGNSGEVRNGTKQRSYNNGPKKETEKSRNSRSKTNSRERR